MFAVHAELIRRCLSEMDWFGVGDFGQQHILVLPGDDVPRARDPDASIRNCALELSHREDIEQFRMERSSVELKHQILDRRPDQ